MNTDPIIAELEILEQLVALDDIHLLEAGCGAAGLARRLLDRHAGTRVVGVDVDERQLAKNLAAPTPRLHFERAGAQDLPFDDGAFDGAMMLKSLHHVPVALMAQALGEMARVLKPGGWLYVSEPVYAGALNDVIRLYNDEGEVRAAAQAALDRAVASGHWTQAAERRFEIPVRFEDFDDFERRMMHPTFTDHHLDDALVEKVRAAFSPHQRPDGARFTRPMHVRLLRPAAGSR
ncbi:MAG: methyltransferase domain-containing protein [Lautropia sp.]